MFCVCACCRMSVIDIKNYLEKIYKVPVLDVKTKVMAGKGFFDRLLACWSKSQFCESR